MIAVVQRVLEANVTVDGDVVGRIARGLVVLVAVHATDTVGDVAWTAAKLAGLRVFPAGDKHYDLDVTAAGGTVLLVSNFTVAAETRQGRRPSLDAAAKPDAAKPLFEALAQALRELGVAVETGRYQAAMRVGLVNDGPCTFLVDSRGSRA